MTRVLQDRSERCREAGVDALLSLLERAPDAALALLPYASPVLTERLPGDGAVAEPSEVCPLLPNVRSKRFSCVPHAQEVRAKLALLVCALASGAGGVLGGHSAWLLRCVESLLKDPAPCVVAPALRAASQLAASAGRGLGAGGGARLAARLVGVALSARAPALRAAALPPLRDALLLCCARAAPSGADAPLLHLVGAEVSPGDVPVAHFYAPPDGLPAGQRVNALAALAADPSPQVRCGAAALVGALLAPSSGVSPDHAPRLLPYILAAADPHAGEAGDVAAAAGAAVAAAAEGWAAARAARDACGAAAGAHSSSDDDDESDDQSDGEGGGGGDGRLCCGRPPRAARRMVRDALLPMLRGAAGDARRAPHRLPALVLLHALLRHGEGSAAAAAHDVLRSLPPPPGGARDAPAAAAAAARCAVLLGARVPAAAWAPTAELLLAEARGAGAAGDAARIVATSLAAAGRARGGGVLRGTPQGARLAMGLETHQDALGEQLFAAADRACRGADTYAGA